MIFNLGHSIGGKKFHFPLVSMQNLSVGVVVHDIGRNRRQAVPPMSVQLCAEQRNTQRNMIKQHKSRTTIWENGGSGGF